MEYLKRIKVEFFSCWKLNDPNIFALTFARVMFGFDSRYLCIIFLNFGVHISIKK